MTLQEMRDQKAKLIAEARALQAKETLTDEESAKFKELLDAAGKMDQRIQDAMALDGLSDPQDAARIAANASPRVEGGETPPVYANIGEQLLDVMAMTTGSDLRAKSAAAERHLKVVNAASGASAGIDGEGGYLIETQHAQGIMTTAIETGVLASRCSVQPIGANADSFSYMAARDRDRSDGMINGVQVYRKGEATTLTQGGKALLEERELKVEDMYGLVYMTNRMLRDAVAMSTYTKRVLRQQLAFKLDLEIWEGTGAGQCLGITKSDLPVIVAKESGQTATTIVAANVVKMLSRFKGDMSRAAWFVNQDCLPQFPLMTVGNQPVFIPGGSFTNAPHGTLFGLPIVPIEFAETLGAQGDITLADWSEYLLITKGGVEEAESIHVKFLTDETAFRFIVRNNGQPMYDSPITPLNGSNTLSPFVQLAVRS